MAYEKFSEYGRINNLTFIFTNIVLLNMDDVIIELEIISLSIS